MIEKNWLDLKKPDELEIKQSEYNPSQAVIEVGPFERGFGVTIGNALRRVLLSSLQGSAISAVQIQGVVHEFSSIPGVREDVTDLVLNLKGVAVRVDDDSPKRLRLAAEGPATVTAGMISESAGVEIMNPDHVLCQLDKGASVSMELTVTPGRAMSRLAARAAGIRRSASFRLTRSTARFARSPTRWTMPVSARSPTMTNFS